MGPYIVGTPGSETAVAQETDPYVTLPHLAIGLPSRYTWHTALLIPHGREISDPKRGLRAKKPTEKNGSRIWVDNCLGLTH